MPDTVTARRDQSGQMLVSVIVLLTLMFFIGSAMALAVSSSLQTIAQTNNTDSAAYAAESAVAQGFARTATPVPWALAPTVASAASVVPVAPPAGCNNGISGGGNSGNGGNGGNGSSVSAAPVPGGTTTWSYAYEVVADEGAGRDLVGRSAVGTDNQGPNALTTTSYETITIPHINYKSIPGATSKTGISFEVYRTAAGGSPSTKGCVGVFGQQPGGTTVTDSGPISPAPPMCTRSNPPAPLSQVNNFGPAGTQGPLSASTCRVPIATEANALQVWSAPAQTVGACVQHTLTPAFSPGNAPSTVWGVVGWHSKSKASLTVSTSSCTPGASPGNDNCYTSRATAPPTSFSGVLYYWCQPGANTPISAMYIINSGGKVSLSPFIVRAAATGTDCVATTIGEAGPVATTTGETGPVVDEAARRMPGCGWTDTTQTLWNRVLP